MGKKKYRYGFKAEVNGYAREFRAELERGPRDPLCPRALAKHLEIPVEPLSAYISEIPKAVEYFTQKNTSSFSGMTICDGFRRRIIFNDSHHPYRQAADIAHELAHGILGHIPLPILDQYGCRHFNKEDEDEAEWFGPALLISEEAALHIVKTGMSMSEAAEFYGASIELINFRINMTGAKVRVARMNNRYRRNNQGFGA